MDLYARLKDHETPAEVPGVLVQSRADATSIVVVSGSASGWDVGCEAVAEAVAACLLAPLIASSGLSFADAVEVSIDDSTRCLQLQFGDQVDELSSPCAVSASLTLVSGSLVAATIGNMVVVLLAADGVHITTPHIVAETLEDSQTELAADAILELPLSLLSIDRRPSPRLFGPWPTQPGDRLVITSAKVIGWLALRGDLAGWRTCPASSLAARLPQREHARFHPIVIVDL